MDALLAKAASSRKPRKKTHPRTRRSDVVDVVDPTLASIAPHTALPRSLRLDPDPHGDPPARSYAHVPNRKLRAQLGREATHAARAQGLREDAAMLLTGDAGALVPEGPLERTWRVSQDAIAREVGREAARGRQEWALDGGPYRGRYSRNGRHIALVGATGHVATLDWQTGTLHAEMQLRETCRDITFLQDQSYFAVAQEKYVFIYDRDGVELHRLKAHVEPTRLEFLPYHWLLASVGHAGYLKYQDTSTGAVVAEHRTKAGACRTMAQNRHNAVLYLGHQQGVVSLWTPNLAHPAVQLLAHLGPVVGLSVDPSTGGRYMASAGQDGTVKVWDCRNWKGAVRQWTTRGGGAELEWSAKGALAVATGGSVNVYAKPGIQTAFEGTVAPPLYLTHAIPRRPLTSVRFCPFQDVLLVGHQGGLSSVLVPGSGEPNFDSAEADPFEDKKRRQEREVKGLLDKIPPDMIALDPDFVGGLGPATKLTTAVHDTHEVPFGRLPRLERLRVEGKADEAEMKEGKEEREKRRMRGKGKSLKRYLRKQRKNVVDPTAVAVRAKLEKQREERRRAKAEEAPQKRTALDRFK